MRVENAVTGLMVITPKLARVLVWTIFSMVHLTIIVITLALFWWFQISPDVLRTLLAPLFQSSPASTIAGTVAFLGLSGSGALLAYAKSLKWLFHKLLEAFLFAE